NKRDSPRRTFLRFGARASPGLVALSFFVAGLLGASSPDVVINEVAWMGTAADWRDEWIELRNNTDRDVSLAGWTLLASGWAQPVPLAGVIIAQGYFLLERFDDTTVGDIHADQTYTGGLVDEGGILSLRDAAGQIVDTANADGGTWPAGIKASRSTMERVNPFAPDQDPNWRTNDGTTRNGKDAKGNPLNGTPRSRNSCTNPPVARFSWSPDPAAIWDAVLFLDESTDRDGTVLSWAWTFGDGNLSFERSPTHEYRSPGTYLVSLEVADNDGLMGSVREELRIAVGKGDVDENGTVDVIDVRIVLQAALGLVHLTTGESEQADVDRDGDIDSEDARLLAEHVIGM
ncbi:MAG: PKD domain-containing protein, partial [Candidatus Bipolaricaulota bacterium]|nr:PKD domain-containing protein [Candidatus Bipolaricaulota bacterium]